MWNTWRVETTYDRHQVAEFLQTLHLQYDYQSDVTVEVRQGERIVATGSLRGSVLQCFGVASELQGEGHSNKIVDHLTQVAFERGHTRIFVFTSPENVSIFRSMGFRVLASTAWAALLENGFPSIDDYLNSIARHVVSTTGRIGGLVMNCNPFTLGHQYLAEHAANYCD